MWKELILWGSAGLLLAAGAGFAYLVLRHPETAPASGLKIESTPARLARGKHIFEHVADCEGCHSQRDYTRLGGPPLPSMRGAGQEFPDELGLRDTSWPGTSHWTRKRGSVTGRMVKSYARSGKA